ncbi:MAG: chemotaxis protein CheW [Nanobdellota archaeon]
MDLSKYKKEFVMEVREHLDSLNQNLLDLEDAPQDEDTINNIFRSFHTLKGNAATMGYTKFSDLAHSLENVLSKIRDGEFKVTQNVMNSLFEGCDVMEDGLEKIENDTPDDIHVENLINELSSYLDVDTHNNHSVAINETIELDAGEKKKISELKKKKYSVYRLVALFDSDNPLKAAKAQILIRDIGDKNIIKTTPTIDEIKKAKFNTEIEIVLSSKKKKEDVKQSIGTISGIKNISVLDLDEAYKKDEKFKHEENERAKHHIAKKHHDEVTRQIQSVRVDMDRLDKIMNVIGELLIYNIRLQDLHQKKDYKSLDTIMSGINGFVLDLKSKMLDIRMVPMENIFKRFPRMVRDLAQKENKKVDFQIEGGEIELDRTILDKIGEPLVHILRNSVDHGIETPSDRKKAGKQEQGNVRLIARREKNNAVVEITDDGAGIDADALKEKCLKKGIITKEQANKMSEQDLQMLVFSPGVSTSDNVTEVSGRGVGMDVVMSSVKELGGDVKISSELGKGSTITLQLPLTIAIVSVLLVNVAHQPYALPLSNINQILEVKKEDVKTIQGKEVFIMRGSEVPLLWLDEFVGEGRKSGADSGRFTVVVVEHSDKKIGLVLDSIIGQRQILIKSLDGMVKGVKGFAGATILGDGRIALVYDVPGFFRAHI